MPSEIRGSSNFDSDSVGKVLQQETTIWTTRYNANTYSPVDFFSCSITPTKATSTLLVEIRLAIGYTNDYGFYLKRDGTKVNGIGFTSTYSDGTAIMASDQNSYIDGHGITYVVLAFKHNANSTSTTTFTIGNDPYGTDGNATCNINRDSVNRGGASSSITITEIGA